MSLAIFHSLREFVASYGYWAVAIALLCENAGLPVPGETTLLLASFLAYSEHRLQFGWILAVATCSATLGDNVGYAIGHYGGRPFFDRYQRFFRISPHTLARGQQMFERYGAATVFFARFIFGLRVFAGPLAGVLRMRWRTFFFYNSLGAVVWVTCIASAGYLFGRHWHSLMQFMERFNIAVFAIAICAILFLLRRYAQSSTRP